MEGIINTISLFIYPFTACVVLVLIHVYFGIHILERGIIFVDLSLAQFIGLGIAASFLIGDDAAYSRYFFVSLFAVMGAFILSLSRQIARFINIEAFIGVIYIFSLSATILILDRTPHGLEEFKTILNGSILWLTPFDLLYTFILYSVIGILHFLFRKRFFALSYEGRGNFFWEFIFFLSFAIVIFKSVQIAGILQVFSFLVIPTMIGRLYSRKPSTILLWGWLIGIIVSFLSIIISYKYDFPASPVIAISLSIILFFLIVWRGIFKDKNF